MKACVITIGDEILIGQIVDTNTVSIARHLNSAGISVVEKLSIGDDAQAICDTVRHALTIADIVVITGGLGPTKDDITKYTLAEMFDSRLVYNETEAEHIRSLLARRGIEFGELNRSQAMVPECSKVLHNAHGTAPGMWFDCGDDRQKVVVSLPGVPFEMEHLMQDQVMPRLKSRFDLHSIVHRTMITRGIPESVLASTIARWENALPPGVKLAYLPSPNNTVRLRLSAYDVDGEATAAIIDNEFSKLYSIIPDNIVGFEDATVERLVHDLLIERGKRLAVAESCTGGAIAAKFTAMPGASAYFMCGVVSYSNEAKRDVLGVDMADIERYGAVSESVARQMAEGARRISGSDYAISTTGIAGPTGGSEQKPVGTVWFGVATPERSYAVMRSSGTDRSQIIARASAYAIELLLKELTK